jgi:hypothetical protein
LRDGHIDGRAAAGEEDSEQKPEAHLALRAIMPPNIFMLAPEKLANIAI